MFIKTLTFTELREGDILFYRPKTLFGILIGFYTAIRHWRFDIIAFSHVAVVLLDKFSGKLKRFDALEGKKTGFRDKVGEAYVFRMEGLGNQDLPTMKHYFLSREGSEYDRRGILSFIFGRRVREDEFRDYCSEMLKNGFVAC